MKNFKNYKGYALYILLTCVLCVGCYSLNNNNIKPTTPEYKLGNDYKVIVIDSCEYVEVFKVSSRYGITHKGNCKYCAERAEANAR